MSFIKKGQFFSSFALAAMASVALVGCGGSDSSIDVGPTTDVNGRSEQQSATTQEAVSAPAGEARRVNLRGSNGGNIPGLVPGGVTIPANTPVAVLDTSLRPLGDFAPAPEELGAGQSTANVGRIFISEDANEEAEDDGVDTGLVINAQGQVVQSTRAPGDNSIVLPGGKTFRLTIKGPLNIGKGAKRLTILNKFRVIAPVRNIDGNAVIGFVQSLRGSLPSNGGTTFGLSLTSDLPDEFAGATQKLSIRHENGRLVQERVSNAAGAVVFRDAVLSGSSSIPRKGVDTVIFRVRFQ
jgi:hypothetical protein